MECVELNSKIIYGQLQINKTSIISFEKSQGCLLFLYHPYFGHGLYTFTTFNETNGIGVQTILSANDITINLSKMQLSMMSSKNYDYAVLKFNFITN